MKRMFRLLAIALALGGVVLPPVIGLQAQREYERLLQWLQQQGLTLVLQDYRRGWFRAEADSEFLYGRPGPGAGAPSRLLLESRIEHGPWTQGGWLLAWSETRLRWDRQGLSEPLRTQLGFDGCASLRLKPAALETGGAILGGLAVDTEFDILTSRWRGRLRLDELALSGSNPMAVGGLALDWQVQPGLAEVPQGRIGLRLSEIQQTMGAAGRPSRLEGLVLEVRLAPEGEWLRFALDVQLAQLHIGQLNYGPGEARLRVGNLVLRALKGLQPSFTSEVGPALNPEQAQRLRAGIWALQAPALVQADPRVEIEKLHLTTADGELDARLALQATGMGWPPANLGRVLQQLEGEGELRIPEPLVRALVEARTRRRLEDARLRRLAAGEQVQGEDPTEFERQLDEVIEFQLKALVNQRGLVPEAGRLVARFSLAQGVLRINDRDLPLALLVE